MTLSEAKGVNKIFAGFIIKKGFSHYLKRMRKTDKGYRCMQFEMDIEKSVIIEKNKYHKPYGRDYYEKVTDIITHKLSIEIQNGEQIVTSRVANTETLPYWL